MTLPIDGIKIKPLNVVAIDDSELMLSQLGILLNEAGVKDYRHFQSSVEGLHYVNKNPVDLLFLDLNMPECDGVTILRELSQSGATASIVLLSGEQHNILKTAENLGVMYNLNILTSIVKPITFRGLQMLINQYYSRDCKPQTYQSGSSLCVSDLQTAINQGQICPYFQPKVSTKSLKWEAAEILARWTTPDGVVSPAEFIPLAEQNGLIDDLTFSLLKQSLEEVTKRTALPQDFNLSLNLSTLTLENITLPEQLESITKDFGIPCHRITLEVTETRIMREITTSLDALVRLRLKGFGLSVDDFGTGYSSMKQLEQIPFTELKIDRSFVHGVSQSKSKNAILESSVELASKLKLTTVVEGLEDPADLQLVLNTGVNFIQGYFFSKPLPAKEFFTALK